MKKIYSNITKYIALSIVVILLFSCNKTGNKKPNVANDNQTNQPTIMVFAAASLTDILNEIIYLYETKFGVKVQTNLASSGTLARQIEQGGIPDVYISASKKWADYVDSLGLMMAGYKNEIAKNELVMIAPANSNTSITAIDSTLNLLSLLGQGRLSVGDPAHVPAGNYAKESLEYFGWYTQLNTKILPAKDVRSALMVVELEEAPIGIVYRTDAIKSEKVKILATFPERSHKPIVYIAGVCNENKAAKDFYTYLMSDEVLPIWNKYGFRR